MQPPYLDHPLPVDKALYIPYLCAMKYFFPAEWHKQQAILLSFPDELTIWKDSLPEIEPFYVSFARAILTYQDLIIICRNAQKQHYIEQLLAGWESPHQLRFFHADYNDIWIRDYGPISLINAEKLKWVDFGFNAWGGKYPGQLDDKVTRSLYNASMLPVDEYERQHFILEGGAIETDGLGTLLTTACAFTPTRNPGQSQQEIIEKIKHSLSVERVIVIEHGYLLGDDTDGHVDTLVRFCNPQTLAYSSCDDKNDPHYASLKAMEAQLHLLTDQQGKPYDLIALPIPAAKFDETGRRLPASYANFLILNGAVLCPTYEDANDALILERLTRAFPTHQVIPIPSLALVQYNGALHCASMQIPAPTGI